MIKIIIIIIIIIFHYTHPLSSYNKLHDLIYPSIELLVSSETYSLR